MTPWQLVDRYRWTLYWTGFIGYLILAYRIKNGQW